MLSVSLLLLHRLSDLTLKSPITSVKLRYYVKIKSQIQIMISEKKNLNSFSFTLKPILLETKTDHTLLAILIPKLIHSVITCTGKKDLK